MTELIDATTNLTCAQQAIQANAAAVAEAVDSLRQSVDEAREGGASWADVGRALGVSRQAAWERFAQRVESEAS